MTAGIISARGRGLQLLQRAAAALVTGGAFVGQALAAGGAVEQPHAQARLHHRNALGHRRARDVQALRRLRKAAGLHRGHELFHSAKLLAH